MRMRCFMRKYVIALTLLFGVLAYAERLSMDGAFEKFAEDGKPVEWTLNNWRGYMPQSSIEVIKGGDGTRNSLRIFNVTAEYGGAIVTQKWFDGRAGDLLQFSFRAKGHGKMALLLGLFFGKKQWSNLSNEKYDVALAEEWRDYMVTMRIPNGQLGETNCFYVTFQFGKDSEIQLSNVNCEHTECEYRGNLPFPSRWSLFGPVDRNYAPESSLLNSLPESFGGVTGVSASRIDNVVDFIQLLGPGAEKCGWAFAELQAPYDCEYTVGAGADWWMEYYLNGEKIFDTMENGNVESPVAITNYIQNVKLRKGSNIIAVKLLTGAASSTLLLGGPKDLNSIVKNIKLSKIDWIESFDGDKCECSGNPELIKGYPTPGLLTITGQGAFHADGKLQIVPAEKRYPMLEDDYRVMSFRIQNFGREARADSELAFRMKSGKGSFEMVMAHKADNGVLKLNVLEDGRNIATYSLPYQNLPADIIVGGNRKGQYVVQANSLAQSSTELFSGNSPFFVNCGDLDVELEFNGKGAEFVADNLIVGRAQEDSIISKVPYKVEPEKEFDPVNAGWKKVFEEEFDGDALDLAKWFHYYDSVPERLEVKDGICKITCDWNQEKTRVTSASVYTKQLFGYGYFEARVKFRKEHGWWSAFWLCGEACTNPFYDCFEIDVYEDYYLRSEKPGGEPRRILDHNLHIEAGNCLKSWNYNSVLPGSLDQFYTIGCKWTPFEISYYLDGKLIKSSANHSPYNSVTFDPFNHSAGITPLRAILSGCCGKSGGDPKDGNFPESFYCDYVRVYEFPQNDIPVVKWTATAGDGWLVKAGDTMKFSVDAKPSELTGSPIKHAYLFDSGFLLDYKSEPPYDFEVLFSKEYYDTTDYVRPGRQNKVPEFGPALHAFSVFVQDEKGAVAHTEPIFKFMAPTGKSRPYKGVAQTIPGKVLLANYDEGGQNVAYYDTTPGNSFEGRSNARLDEDVDLAGDTLGGLFPWEWINYTVDIETAGKYTARLHYGTPIGHNKGMALMLDWHEVGKYNVLPAHDNPGFAVDQFAECEVELAAGRHVLTLVPLSGGVNMKHIEFVKK